MLANVLELNFKGLHQSSGKEKGSCCLLFPSSTNREIRQFSSRCSRATTAEKCTKKRNERAKLLFCQYIKAYWFFVVLVAVVVVVALTPYCNVGWEGGEEGVGWKLI